ncbi:LysR family transcriptional regulator [Acuticoccus sediminis]|uniref:LysR family transcriptional regulator n=1 Tax=Acuticoccus sediminis TaxID=2184697 RepID=A0A8B2NVV6_9HYPH|nr:LysR substrate-binding domain-containing protein [Acuticoccus sediminis]RAI01903.1 LysR family transcriptional regulator [Acuticoccus sediminis]
MDLRDLAFFEAVADSASYEEAALHVGRTKPALTKAVRRLEDEIGARLFDREGRGKRLSPVGLVLLDKARHLRREAEAATREVGEVARGEHGTLRVGSGTTVVEHVLPHACRVLAEQAPQVNIALTVGMSDILQDHLRKGECDLVIAPADAAAQTEFAARTVYRDEMVVAAGPSHPLAGRTVALADLAGQEWVLPSRSMGTRAWLDRVFTSSGLPAPHAKVETSSISALPALVVEMGLLTFAGRGSLGILTEIALPETTLSRSFMLLTRRGTALPPSAARFAEILTELTADAPAGHA